MTVQTPASKQNKARRMVPLRYVLTPIAIILCALIALMIIGAMAPKPAKKPIKIKAPLVDAMPLTKQDVAFSIESQGSVLPRTETNLISEVSGNVVSVSDTFQVGGFFKKGEELLRIDDITYKVALLKAESQLDSAIAELEQEKARGKQARDEWLLTGQALNKAPALAIREPQLKKAQASVKSAEASVTEASIKLERTRIVAPYDAMVKAKHVDIGQYATTGSAIASLFAVDYAEIRLPIKQSDIAFLNLPKINRDNDKGSAVELYSEIDGKTQHWSSQLTRYEGVVDMTSRVHYVVAQVDDPYGLLQGSQDTELRVGSFVKANITGKQMASVYAIPRSAVHGANTIYLVDQENKLHIQDVNLLRSEVDYAYTLDAIDRNHRLVLTNISTPVESMSLRINGEVVEQTAEVDNQNNNDEEEQGDKS